MHHGKRFDVLGFRFGNVAYCTDANSIPPESMERLAGLDVLILDALRPRGHVTHFSLEEAVVKTPPPFPRGTNLPHTSPDRGEEGRNTAPPPRHGPAPRRVG